MYYYYILSKSSKPIFLGINNISLGPSPNFQKPQSPSLQKMRKFLGILKNGAGALTYTIYNLMWI
jgi:hypothetical protein